MAKASAVQRADGPSIMAQVTGTTTTSTPVIEPPVTEPPTTAPAPPPTTPPGPPPLQVPTGKGMWIWQPDQAEAGDVAGIVARAQSAGLTHLYVRTGSSVDGIQGGEFLNDLLPAAHAAGLRILAWDFPYLDDVGVDVDRALQAIRYVTPSGDRLDGFSADIETPAEYVALTPESALAYGAALREGVGPNYPLIATVPRPSPARQSDYPYTEVVQYFDAVAPMVYWIDVSPADATAEAMDFLGAFGKPVLPIGQAYDGSAEGGPPGTPSPADIDAFINTSREHGAAGVSFWSWQHASDDTWSTIAAAPQLGVKPPG
jgi:hypothetical protein